jgi:hypothetical protein
MFEWYDILLTVKGKAKRISEFKRRAKGKNTELSLERLYPMPAKLEQSEENSDKPHWLDWPESHWGTDRDVKATLVKQTENCLVYEFEGSENLPKKWIEKVAKDYPGLDFLMEAVITEGEIIFERIANVE